MWDPNRLASDPTKANIDRICTLLRELYSFTSGNEYITLGLPPQVTQDPAGTPAANTLYKGLIPKAWVHYDQSAAAILDDENISGVTDDAAGLFTVSFDRDFSGADAWAGAALHRLGGGSVNLAADPAVGSGQFRTRSSAGVDTDSPDNFLIFMGRQA